MVSLVSAGPYVALIAGMMLTGHPVTSPRERREVRSLAGYRAWETRRERDEFVAVNVPDELLSLWNRTKLQFSGTPEERLEAFLAYAHDHEDEGIEALADDADARLDAMIAEYQERAA